MVDKVIIPVFKDLNQNQLHAVPRTQQGRQREPSVKTLCSPLSPQFLLSGGTQRRAFPSTPEEEMKRVGIELTTSRFTGTLCAPAPRLIIVLLTN